jgi:hypothetical protein
MKRIVPLAALSLALTAAATIPTKGVTYRVRMTTRLPAIMAQMGANGDAAGPVILAKVKAVGKKSRFDFLSGPQNIGPDDYLLMLDSGRAVMVNAAEKTYSENSNFAQGGLGMLAQLGRRGGRNGGNQNPNGFNGIEVNGLVTDLQELDGDTLEGRNVRHYQAVAEMNINVMNTMAPLRIEMETWTANLPYPIVNPFDLAVSGVPSDDPTSKLTTKLIELRKKMVGTPVKSIMRFTISGLGNGAVPPLEFVQTTAITDIKEMDVDEKEFAIPAGFTKKGPGGP